MTLPPWLVGGAIVRCTIDGQVYEVIDVKAKRGFLSGVRVRLQRLRPPFLSTGKSVDSFLVVPLPQKETDMDLKKLCEDSHRISKDKGWLEGGPRKYSAITALMQSELAEALEDYRNNRGVGEIYYEVKGSNEKVTQADYEKVIGDGADVSKFKPCGIPIELADFVIRLAQHCGTDGWDLAGVVEKKNQLTRRLSWGDFDDMLAWANYFVSLSFAASEKQEIPGRWAQVDQNVPLELLAQAFIVVQDFCHQSEIKGGPKMDLEKAVQIKQSYNETRPHRHGGKKL